MNDLFLPGTVGCGYFCPSRFAADVCETAVELISATRVLWQMTKVKMLPTPAKFHYIFNLRDLSRIWEGMLKIKGEECTDRQMIMLLWKHECTRVIADRYLIFLSLQRAESPLSCHFAHENALIILHQ